MRTWRPLQHLGHLAPLLVVSVLCALVAGFFGVRPQASASPNGHHVIDCGSSDTMSGWPTTTMVFPGDTTSTQCIVRSARAGTPAVYRVRSASSVMSTSKTSDGYTLPEPVTTTYRVLGRRNVAITIDFSAAGGGVATIHCAGLTLGTTWPGRLGPCHR